MKIFWLKDTCISTPSWLWKVIGVMGGGGGRYRFWYKKKTHIIDCLNNKIVTNEKCITFGGGGVLITQILPCFLRMLITIPLVTSYAVIVYLINKICTNIHLLKYLYILLINISNCKHFNKRDNVIKSKRKQCFVIAITLNRE